MRQSPTASFFPVRGLLFWSRPSAIAWRVISIVVDAVERMMGRRFSPHVRNKIIKRMHPSLTNSNSFGAVHRIAIGFFVIATLANIAPSVEFRPPFSFCFSTSAMNYMTKSLFPDLFLEASTTSTMIVRQIPSIYLGGVPAVAQTFPSNGPRYRIFDSFNDNESSKPQARQIADFHRHNCITFNDPIWAGI